MNGWHRVVMGVVGVLAGSGILAAFGLSFALTGRMATAEEKISSGERSVKEQERRVASNTKTTTEWDWFKDQYKEDRKIDREAHKKIMEKLDDL